QGRSRCRRRASRERDQADAGRRLQVHLRAEPGGRGVSGGLHGVAGIVMATLVQAVRLALHYGEEHLGVTDIFGEDVGPPLGGVFTATQGLKTAWNSPLDERGIIGTAMGIAYAGGRPVCEIQFCDYAFNTIDLLKIAGNQRWASAGNYDMPIVLMTPSGSGIR